MVAVETASSASSAARWAAIASANARAEVSAVLFSVLTSARYSSNCDDLFSIIISSSGSESGSVVSVVDVCVVDGAVIVGMRPVTFTRVDVVGRADVPRWTTAASAIGVNSAIIATNAARPIVLVWVIFW